MAGSYARKASTPSKGPAPAKSSSVKGNRSILNFFQKTDTPPGATSRQSRITQFVGSAGSPNSGRGTPASQRGSSSRSDTNGALFLEDKKGLAKTGQTAVTIDLTEKTRSRTPEDIWGDGDDFMGPDDSRYNENDLSTKRRKLDSPNASEENEERDDALEPAQPAPVKQSNSGPFIDESDSEDDMEAYRELKEASPTPDKIHEKTPSSVDDPTKDPLAEPIQSPLVRDAANDTNDEFANFDDLEEDELVGEEFREETWDDEEHEEERHDLGMNTPNDLNQSIRVDFEDEGLSACPVCQRALARFNEMEISAHVNDCLDGKTSTPPPTTTTAPTPIPLPPDSQKESSDIGLTRIERAAIARPAQRDPYSRNASDARSAFSKMMAGNAEDTAWATAAANEVSSRGKQAYQRTCPFYKIMPGFSICVDAFRYGAVEGCNAYFLSHFHSDHYIGLTKSWCHGPIYCSRATGNLVRQQLRVDPKWIVDLDFETTSEVPDTGGVQVTMIPANHCPGSSLFLFEKSFGSGPSVRRQRILHCGDFRASPAHVQHPLLRPDPINPVTGQPRQQRIDTCYLDTTYLNPKYAFPCQDDVITACSELCVRLNQEVGVGSELGNTGTAGLMNRFLSSVTQSDSVSARSAQAGGRLLVVIGTYSIGKERICLGIARALGSKIFATPQKQRVCACLEDPELSALLTSDPREAQVHMQTLFEIRADTLADYLDSLKPHFSRVVGFRPTGWSYRPPAGRMLDNPAVPTVLRGEHWRSSFTAQHLVPQRGSTRESACFGVPYSEHSSFRELTMFCCALRIGRVIPTVNVGSQKSRDQMKIWIERWEGEKKRNGLFSAAEW
ncbi:DNA cross-link repair protein pso2/snm1 [Penicillium canariense]|uniref:DNA cross-link repair protein pso2/snm1 n=1 Tax=Penicillium canariense TaxID=189055 RepID=A0A9W9HWX9_9EURO|nr:DNA cross-link repair protein pso2/snm1 [Penicillium canariense]KAJ5157882.1 DNA cross-link repair protein pso2/snm1 [Penicillium canariense]